MELVKKEFKNEAAYDLATTLQNHMVQFLTRKKGQEFRMIIMTISEVFQEDRYKVRQVLSDGKIEQPTGGGAKIRRAKDEGHAIMKNEQPCDGCPGSADFIIQENLRVIKGDQPKESTAKKIDPDTEPFTSEADILDRFTANANAMLAFCQDKGIEIPNSVKKPKTIAKYIWEFYQVETQNKEQ